MFSEGACTGPQYWQAYCQPKKPPGPHLPLFEDAANVLSERAGLWLPEVAAGTPVTKGTRLGRLEDAFGDEVQELLAPATGVLICGLSSLAAVEGDLLASIARPMPGM